NTLPVRHRRYSWALFRKIVLSTHARQPSERVFAEDLLKHTLGEGQSARARCRGGPGVVAGKEEPVAGMSGRKRPGRGRGVGLAEGEICGVQHAVLIARQKFTRLIPFAPGEIAHARGGVDSEIRMGIQTFGQSLEIVLVAAKVATH